MSSLSRSLYEFGEFHLDAQQRVLRRGKDPVALTPKALDVLVLLVQHSGQLVTKDELMKAVWSDSFVEESNLTQTIFMLRKALGEVPEQRYVLTVPGRGYRFAADVKLVASSPASGAEEASIATEDVPDRWPLLRRWQARVAFVALLGVAFGAYAGWVRPRTGSKPPTRFMLAVLPFQNLTGDASQEYFSDGLTEEMIAQLGNLDPQRLGVIARTSVMHYKGSQSSMDQIGRELGVQYVLEGSVRRDANSVRVTAQLIQTRDQTHLWSRQYDRQLTGILSLQEQIAREVADDIQSTFGDQKTVPAARSFSPEQYESYDLYLKGQYFLNKRTADNLEKAIDYFSQAVAKDPKQARAYAGMADAYALMSGYSSRPQSEFMPKAYTAATRAIEIDDTLPEAHAALALVVQNDQWDWQTAEKELRRAIALNPNYATAHHWYAEHLMWRGRFEEAIAESERARQLDPLSLIIAADHGAILYYARQYDAAIVKFRSVLQMEPQFPRAHLIQCVYVEKGMFPAALADLEYQRPTLLPPFYLANLASIQGRWGHTTEARQALAQLLSLDRRRPVNARVIAEVYLAVGDKEQAIAWLEKAYMQHTDGLTALKVDPQYAPLRADRRFQDLLHRVGLAD